MVNNDNLQFSTKFICAINNELIHFINFIPVYLFLI